MTKAPGRTTHLCADLTDAQAEELGVSELLLNPGPKPTAFQYLPNGVRGLLEAAIEAEGLSGNILLDTPVLGVTNDGVVTWQGDSEQFDSVIVTVRPEAALDILPPPLQQVYEGGVTGLVDVWIFNATILPGAELTANLSDVFLTTVSQNGSLPDRDGTPTFIFRQDAASPFYSVGGYVTDSVTASQSLARASAVTTDYGLNISSTIAYQRIPFPSQLAQPAEMDNFEHVFLLGEALGGVGLDVGLPLVAACMETWFGPI